MQQDIFEAGTDISPTIILIQDRPTRSCSLSLQFFRRLNEPCGIEWPMVPRSFRRLGHVGSGDVDDADKSWQFGTT